MIDTCGKEVRTIAHDDMTSPHGVAVDKDESVYVTDYYTGSVLKFNRDGRLVKTCKGLQRPNCSSSCRQQGVYFRRYWQSSSHPGQRLEKNRNNWAKQVVVEMDSLNIHVV